MLSASPVAAFTTAVALGAHPARAAGVTEDTWYGLSDAAQIVSEHDQQSDVAVSETSDVPDLGAAVVRLIIASAVIPDGNITTEAWFARATGMAPGAVIEVYRNADSADHLDVYRQAARDLRKAPPGASMRSIARNSGVTRHFLRKVDRALGITEFVRQEFFQFVFEHLDEYGNQYMLAQRIDDRFPNVGADTCRAAVEHAKAILAQEAAA